MTLTENTFIPKPKYLITGSHGFIGSAVIRHFLSKGEVRSIPRDMLYDRWDLQRYIEAYQPNFILHFAAYGNHSTQIELGEIVEANIHCTLNLLEASKNVSYIGFINTSSSSVTLPKQTFYSASKMATEYFCKAYDKPIVSIRPASVYGEGEAAFRFIPTVVRSAKEKKIFDLVPQATHDWIYINDFIAGIDTVLEQIEGLIGEHIAIGTGESHTNLEIVQAIERIHGSKIEYNLVESMRSYDNEHWVTNNSLLKLLGWKQRYALEEGLRRVYDLA